MLVPSPTRLLISESEGEGGWQRELRQSEKCLPNRIKLKSYLYIDLSLFGSKSWLGTAGATLILDT